jgi:hypothetical protein
MEVHADGRPVSPGAVSLDDLGWDHAATRGTVTVEVTVGPPELAAVGRALHAWAAEALDEDPDYFSGPTMDDVPGPPPEDAFERDPGALAGYLDHPFWARLAVLALLDALQPQGAAAPGLWLQDFRGAREREGCVVLEFGASP